jgi:hypothetical protein
MVTAQQSVLEVPTLGETGLAALIVLMADLPKQVSKQVPPSSCRGSSQKIWAATLWQFSRVSTAPR